jgi:hypothetical protein
VFVFMSVRARVVNDDLQDYGSRKESKYLEISYIARNCPHDEVER